jgi:hypothetical protein
MPLDTPPQATLAPEKPTVQGQFSVMSFTVAGTKVSFPVVMDDVSGGNRIIRIPRPNRDGEKLDDTGADARIWTPRAVFGNSIWEEGLDPSVPLYPDLMLAVLRLFAKHETGDLFVPTDGLARARAHQFKRVTPEDAVDFAVLELTFIEDSEESIGAAAFATPTVLGRHLRLAEQTAFSMEYEDNWSDLVTDIKVLCSDLAGILQAPGRAVEDSQAQARAIAGAIGDVARVAEEQTGLARTGGTSPPAPAAVQRLSSLLDLSWVAAEERQRSLPATVPFRVATTTTIFELAAFVKQPAEALLDLNGERIEDPFYVPPGTYRVYQHWP